MVKIKSVSHSRPVNFYSDGYLLKGMLHLPSVVCPPVVIGSHGLLSTSDSPKQIALADRCNRHGIAFLRFDHRGCGRSQGILKEVTSLEARAADLGCAVRWIRKRRDLGDSIGLFGISMGGAACLYVAAATGVDAVVTFAAPIRIRTIHHSEHPVNGSVTASNQTAELNLQFDISDRLGNVGNILIFHGDADEIVPFADAFEIYNGVAEPKELIRQKGGDHLMSRKTHQDRFVRETASWFETRLFGSQRAHTA
jgi:alpha/beta superfamily hydrolase